MSKWRSSLNLPTTKFSLNRSITGLWTKDLYIEQLKRTWLPTFVLQDGPPYANGPLHIGHALNKVLKDITCRFKLLQGHRIEFKPGWDCHGLPIELKAIGSNHYGEATLVSKEQIRKKARNLATKTIEVQKKGFINMEVMADWNNPYTTMQPEYQQRQLRVFQSLLDQGYIYRRRRPIFWSPSTKTALAEAELEYMTKTSKSVFVKFPIIDNNLTTANSNENLLIWTTTPWTLPANKAICVNPDLDYVLIEASGGEKYWICEDKLPALIEKLPLNISFSGTKTKGRNLTGVTYRNPLNNQINPVIAAEHVTNQSGTGLVHTAPGHGMEDYLACISLDIAPFSPVDDQGRFTAETGTVLQGLYVLNEGTNVVLEMLKTQNMLILEEDFTHSYPHDWRTKKPVIIRATEQWFCDLTSVKQKAQDVLKDVTMIPEHGRTRLSSFLKGRSEWCISRQRAWGVPIPALYSKGGKVMMTPESVEHILNVFDQRGVDSWWKEPSVKPFLPPFLDSKEGEEEWIRGEDTMDVWFDSGTAWTMQHPRIEKADLYLEGSDQHRGWFQSSILTSVALTNKAPFKALLTHGFVLDESGKKMSKSEGNIIEPQRIISEKGIDVLRTWVASTEYTSDVQIGPNVIDGVGESVRKFRTTLRFIMGNLNNYPGDVEYEDLLKIDKYMLLELEKVTKTTFEHYQQFDYNKVYQEMNGFTNTLLSPFYFEAIKDRLYAESVDSVKRRACQTVLAQMLKRYLLILAPICVSLTEEAFVHAKEIPGLFENNVLFLNSWPKPMEKWSQDEALESDWMLIRRVKSLVNQSIEALRRPIREIASSLEVKVTISAKEGIPEAAVLKRYEDELSTVFNCSELQLLPNNKGTREGLEVKAEKTKLRKCPRCWIYRLKSEEESLCERCLFTYNKLRL